MSYEQDMYIDENALDMELLDQAQLMAKYSRLFAEARKERDLAKENVDYVKAQVDRKIRKDPLKFDLDKVTETAILNTITLSKEYREAMEDYNETNFEFNVLQGVVSAIEHRKSALENLVKLHGQEYFASPATAHDLSEMREKRKTERAHRVGASLKDIKKKTK